MYLFAYGSLMNAASLHKTLPDAKVVGVDQLAEYRRVFNFMSPYRHNPDTGIFSSVLNLQVDPNIFVAGIVLDTGPRTLELLREREAGYEHRTMTLMSGKQALVYISDTNLPYSFVEGDPFQEEYLQLCLDAAKEYGFLENFLASTFIAGRPIGSLRLHTNVSI